MSVVERAKQGYGRNAAPIKSHRAAEYEAIAKISHRLRAACLSKDSNFPEYIAALHENRKLWSTLAIDVAHPDNGLPQELRARLFWLAEFTESETSRLMRQEGDPAVLIEVNAAVLQGLRGQSQEAQR
ncbi:MAG: flagellar biosynthesis regulator FlaF [Silicimonas sp.]|nr:flagellar biosynthesis regulator FlaF [Silicimonas sp.]